MLNSLLLVEQYLSPSASWTPKQLGWGSSCTLIGCIDHMYTCMLATLYASGTVVEGRAEGSLVWLEAFCLCFAVAWRWCYFFAATSFSFLSASYATWSSLYFWSSTSTLGNLVRFFPLALPYPAPGTLWLFPPHDAVAHSWQALLTIPFCQMEGLTGIQTLDWCWTEIM